MAQLHRIGARALALAIVALAAAAPLWACLWDEDTLKEEMHAKPDIARALIEAFPVNPPEYYQARLERCEREYATTPDKLSLYDDAAVACDRLGRSDDAIMWMERKHAAMERVPVEASDGGPDHRYRYYANLGTFYAHRWFHNGRDVTELGDLDLAILHIEKAIEINRDAHFGREIVQLAVLRWVSAMAMLPDGHPERQRGLYTALSSLPDAEDYQPHHGVAMVRMQKAYLDKGELLTRGLTGLILLGNARSSLDVHMALIEGLGRQRDGRLAHLAQFRAKELHDAGARPLFSETSLQYLESDRSQWVQGDAGFRFDQQAFNELRKETRAWQQARTDYLLAGIKRGEHPDSHPNFWEDFDSDPSGAHLGEVSWSLDDWMESNDVNNQIKIWAFVAAVFVIVLVIPVWLISRYIIRRRRQDNPQLDLLRARRRAKAQ